MRGRQLAAVQRLAIAAACALLAASASCLAKDVRPEVGGFGFDWLSPRSAKCQQVSEQLAKRFRACEYHEGAFGLSDRARMCRLDDRSEYVIFETRDACTRNLEAMKANAP